MLQMIAVRVERCVIHRNNAVLLPLHPFSFFRVFLLDGLETLRAWRECAPGPLKFVETAEPRERRAESRVAKRTTNTGILSVRARVVRCNRIPALFLRAEARSDFWGADAQRGGSAGGRGLRMASDARQQGRRRGKRMAWLIQELKGGLSSPLEDWVAGIMVAWKIESEDRAGSNTKVLNIINMGANAYPPPTGVSTIFLIYDYISHVPSRGKFFLYLERVFSL